MKVEESVYEKTVTRNEDLSTRNLGFDYKGQILKRTVSKHLFTDPDRAEIFSYIENILYFLVENVKTIKTFYNYTVPKNYRKLN